MFHNLDQSCYITLPQKVYDSLDKKTKDNLKKAIEAHRTQGFAPFVEDAYSQQCGQVILRDTQLLLLSDKDYEPLNTISKLIVGGVHQRKRAEAMEGDIGKYKKLKESVSNIREHFFKDEE